MIAIWALAMNPNLTEAEFIALTDQAFNNRIKLIESATKHLSQLPPEQRLQFFRTALPLLLA